MRTWPPLRYGHGSGLGSISGFGFATQFRLGVRVGVRFRFRFRFRVTLHLPIAGAESVIVPELGLGCPPHGCGFVCGCCIWWYVVVVRGGKGMWLYVVV